MAKLDHLAMPGKSTVDDVQLKVDKRLLQFDSLARSIPGQVLRERVRNKFL